MRIMMLVSSMDSGGAERVAALLCNQWAEEGHHVTLMPTFSGRGGVAFSLSPAVELTFLADKIRPGIGRSAPGRLLALRRAIGERRPDIIISFLTNVNVAAILASRGLGIPIAVSERTYPPLWPLSKFWEIARRLVYPFADTVVMQTRMGLDWLSETIPAAHGKVIANPILFPLPDYEPRVNPKPLVTGNERLLLAVGRLHPLKGFGLLIRAFALLRGRMPDVKLAILGEGPDRPSLERDIANLHLDANVLMPGRVGNLAEWYARADGFVQTSRVEGFPNALLEALASGLPVVALDCPTGPSELISNGKNGHLLPLSADEAMLADALEAMLTNPWPTLASYTTQFRDRFAIDRIATEWIDQANARPKKNDGRTTRLSRGKEVR